MADKDHYIIRLQNNIHRLDGPFSEVAIIEGLKNGDFSWGDFILSTEEPVPVRLYEMQELQPALPTPPSTAILETFVRKITGKKEKTKTQYPRDREWLIQISGSEFGPFPPSKIVEMLGKYRKLGDFYVWREGMENWAFAASIDDLNQIFRDFYSGSKKPKDKPLEIERNRNQRSAPRLGAVATVTEITSQGKRVILGVCGNLSMTGLLLLHKEPIGSLKKGQSLVIEIQPLTASGLNPIQSDVMVQWISDRKSGLLFIKTSLKTQKNLEKYFVSKLWSSS